jgi:hypothetical protein
MSLPAPYADGAFYLAMARGESVIAPFRARVLTPWIVRHLPVDPLVGFLCVTIVAILGFLVAYGRRRDWSSVLVLASLYYPVLYSFKNPYLVDPVLFLCLFTAATLLPRGRGAGAALALTIGALDKEVILLAVPLLLWYRPKWSLLGAAAAIAITAALRWPSSTQAASLASTNPRGIAAGFLLAGVACSGWIYYGWRTAQTHERRTLVVVGLGVVILTVGATDTGRMLGLAAPFWLPIASQGATRLHARTAFVVSVVSTNLIVALPLFVPTLASILPVSARIVASACCTALPLFYHATTDRDANTASLVGVPDSSAQR